MMSNDRQEVGHMERVNMCSAVINDDASIYYADIQFARDYAAFEI